MFKHRHKAVLFEQEELRLPNGDYPADAPERLHKFWLGFGLYMEFEPSGMGPNILLLKHIRCIEDVS